MKNLIMIIRSLSLITEDRCTTNPFEIAITVKHTKLSMNKKVEL